MTGTLIHGGASKATLSVREAAVMRRFGFVQSGVGNFGQLRIIASAAHDYRACG